jgi:hypothetical protein
MPDLLNLQPFKYDALDSIEVLTKNKGLLDNLQSTINQIIAVTYSMGATLLGDHDASTAAYPSSPSAGDAWRISVAGTISAVAYVVGDLILYTGSAWVKNPDPGEYLFLPSGAVIDFGAGDVKLTHSANKASLSGGDLEIAASQKITTDTIDETTADAGVTVESVQLKDGSAFFGSGAVLNFDSGDMTVTHSAGALSFSGNLVIANSQYVGSGGGTGLYFDAVYGPTLRGAGDVSFIIDSNDTTTNEDFYWGKDGTTVGTATALMKLNESGLLSLGGSAIFGSTSVSPDGPLHVYSGSAGAVTAISAADDLVVENSGGGGVSLLTPDANSSALYFGSPSDNFGAGFQYNYDGQFLRLTTSVVGHQLVLRADNEITNLTLSGASGSELTEIAGDVKMQNDKSFLMKDALGTQREVMTVSSGDDFYLGNAGLDDTYIRTGTGHSGYLQENAVNILEWSASGVDVTGDFSVSGFLSFGTPTELTISAGVVTATGSSHKIDTESDAASDDLDTINGGSAGDILILRAADGARTVVLKDGTGNLALEGDFSLDAAGDQCVLQRTEAGYWNELSRADNG